MSPAAARVEDEVLALVEALVEVPAWVPVEVRAAARADVSEPGNRIYTSAPKDEDEHADSNRLSLLLL